MIDTLLMLRWYISSKLSTVAGTQCIDRVWQNLKKWLPRKLQAVEKRKGHHFGSKEVDRMLLQWMWRQSVLPCSPKDMMHELLKLLKRHVG